MMSKFSWHRSWPAYCTGAISALLGSGVTIVALPSHWPTAMYTAVYCAGGMVSACIGAGLIWLQERMEAKAHRYDHYEIDDNDPMIIELRRRARVPGLPTPPWHREDGA